MDEKINFNSTVTIVKSLTHCGYMLLLNAAAQTQVAGCGEWGRPALCHLRSILHIHPNPHHSPQVRKNQSFFTANQNKSFFIARQNQ